VPVLPTVKSTRGKKIGRNDIHTRNTLEKVHLFHYHHPSVMASTSDIKWILHPILLLVEFRRCRFLGIYRRHIKPSRDIEP
jgi:hypothetical protein